MRTAARPVRALVIRSVGWLAVAAVAVAAGLDGGCNAGAGSTTQPTTVSQRQDSALRDPMNYKQPVGADDGNRDLTHFDSNGFRHDVNDLLNP